MRDDGPVDDLLDRLQNPYNAFLVDEVTMDEAAAEIIRLRAERDALQARVTELERLTKSLAAERNQLIGVLQLAVEQSGETGENEPAWLGPACRIMNAGFTKIAALEGKKDE